jgi:hypothetical protein
MDGEWRRSVCSCVMRDTWYSRLYLQLKLYFCCVTHNKGEVEIESHAFVTSAPGGVNSQLYSPAALHVEKRGVRYALYSRCGGPHSWAERQGCSSYAS